MEGGLINGTLRCMYIGMHGDEGQETWPPQLWQGVVLASCGSLLVFVIKQT